MRKINENSLSKEVAKVEGKKVEVNIAQIKEVQNCLLNVLATNFTDEQITELVSRHR
jgi:hypothetical protein